VRLLWCFLLLALLLGSLALACATAMRSTGGCTTLPTVEQCKTASLRITNPCLRACV